MSNFPIIEGHRYFESQEDSEKVISMTRKHWFALVSPFVYGLFVAALFLLFSDLVFEMGERLFGDFGQGAVGAFKSLIVLFVLLASFGTWLIRYLNVIIVTNKHLVDISQKAYFSRSVATLALQDIEDVSIEKNGLLATILDFGTLRIQTAGELPNFELRSVADPEAVQRQIMFTRNQQG